ncbi:MAG: segregation/condensation protein A, partial [Gammaproteobacteria bacterium]|nr:segregation/condensation protein A [Gammaproteobacteria bacterium]
NPRAELVRRLQEYERFKQAAEDLNELPRVERDLNPVELPVPDRKVVKFPPRVEMKDLVYALRDVLVRADNFTHHHIEMEPLSVRERMSVVLQTLSCENFTDFSELFNPEEGRAGVVVTLLAILELVKQSLIELVQAESFGQIHVKAAGGKSAANDAAVKLTEV